MITLRNLFQITWGITELDITAREPDTTQYVHRWLYGEKIDKPIHIRHEQEAGRLSIIEKKINAHGGGEIAWGVKEKLLPADLIDAPITHLRLTSRYQGKGQTCAVDIELNRLTAAKYIVPYQEEGENDAL